MSEVVLVSIYLCVLAAFVGLDVISKVPPAGYAAMVAVLGALTGFGALGPVGLRVLEGSGSTPSSVLAGAGLLFGGAALGAGAMALDKVLSAFRKEPHS